MSNQTADNQPCFVIPFVEEKVESILPVKVVTSIKDIGLIAAGVIVSFENLRVLKMIAEYSDLFEDIDFIVLAGFPEAVYNEAFNQVVWSMSKVSFDQLVGELTAQQRVDAIKKDQTQRGKTGPKAEAKAKPFSNFEMHADLDSPDDNPEE